MEGAAAVDSAAWRSSAYEMSLKGSFYLRPASDDLKALDSVGLATPG
jgi:hypothetical protein